MLRQGLLLALTSSAHTPTLPISFDGSEPAPSLLIVEPLKRRFVEIERAGLILGPREGRAESFAELSAAIFASGALAALAALGAVLAIFELVSFGTAIILSGTSLGVKAGGEVIGKPGSCGVEEVRIDVVSMALVESDGDVAPASGCRSSAFSLLLTEDGVLVASRSSDLRGGFIAADRRLSEAGLEEGGGIETLSRVADVLVCDASACALFRSVSFGARRRWDEGARPAAFKVGPRTDEVVEFESTAVKG